MGKFHGKCSDRYLSLLGDWKRLIQVTFTGALLMLLGRAQEMAIIVCHDSGCTWPDANWALGQVQLPCRYDWACFSVIDVMNRCIHKPYWIILGLFWPGGLLKCHYFKTFYHITLKFHIVGKNYKRCDIPHFIFLPRKVKLPRDLKNVTSIATFRVFLGPASSSHWNFILWLNLPQSNRNVKEALNVKSRVPIFFEAYLIWN